MQRTMSARVVSGGRVTIDSEIRRDLSVDVGDYVVLRVHSLEGLVSNGSKQEQQKILEELAERNGIAEHLL